MPTCRLLEKVVLLAGDIRDMSRAILASLQQTTILYAHNKVFMDESNASLEQLACDIRGLHTLVVAVHPCPRHSARCFKELCMKWSLEQVVEVRVSWTSTVAPLYVFRRV